MRITVLEKNVRTCIDEQRDLLLVRCLTKRCDTLRLPGDRVEPLSVDNSVLEVHSDNAEVENPSDILRKPRLGFAVSAFEVYRYGQLDRSGDPPGDLFDNRQRNGLAVAIALRFGDGPTAGRNRLCTRVDDGFRASRIPGVVEDDGLAFAVELGELLR